MTKSAHISRSHRLNTDEVTLIRRTTTTSIYTETKEKNLGHETQIWSLQIYDNEVFNPETAENHHKLTVASLATINLNNFKPKK